MNENKRYSTLIDVSSLKLLAADDVRIIDTRFDLMDTDAGRRAFHGGHLPNAVYADLDCDLSAPVTDVTGRHPLPEPDVAAKIFGKWGISGQTQVVIYDEDSGALAARLWWMLRWLGHENAAVLDGGLASWCSAGGELSSKSTKPDRCQFYPYGANAHMLIDTHEIAGRMDQDDGWLIDARSQERFDGISEPIDTVAGHIPGAVCRPFDRNLDENGRFLPAPDLRDQFKALLGQRLPSDIVCMCGSGVTACHNILAMEHAGLHGARLYVGSWSEWIREPDRPVVSAGQ